MEPARAFEQIFNFRDYGGYPADGGRLVTGRLFRSGHHYSATPGDLELFVAHDVATIIDLRGDSERRTHPCKRHARFGAEILFVPGETADAGGPRVSPANEAAYRDRMRAVYRALPFQPALVGTYRLFLDALIDRPGASMVHCFAGKDRTGIACALVHHLTSVHHDDLVADYLRESDPALIERRLAVEAESTIEWYGPLSDAAMRTMFGVEPSYLDAAFDEITRRHGSIGKYAEAALGVTPGRREALKAALIV